MDVELVRTTYADPVVAALVDAQEREVMARYESDEYEPGPDAGDAAVLVYLEGRAVGCVAIRRLDDRTGEIKRMYVEPAARGQGLSRRLLDAVHLVAREHAFAAVRLETGTRQPEAIGLYLSAGYAAIPCYGYWKDDPETRCFEKRWDG